MRDGKVCGNCPVIEIKEALRQSSAPLRAHMERNKSMVEHDKTLCTICVAAQIAITALDTPD